MSRPRWASPDVPLALLVLLGVTLAFVLPSRLGGDPDPAQPGAGPVSRPPLGPQDVLPAPTISPRADVRGGAVVSGGSAPGGQPGDQAGDQPGGGTAGGGGAAPSASACVDVAVPHPRLTVVSFNMHSGFNRDRSRVAIAEVADELAALDADAYLLQEVDRNRRWTGHVDEPAYLAERLGMYFAFGTNVLRSGDSQYGTAILSRYPVSDARNDLLPAPAGTQQRGLLHVQVAPYGTPVSLYVTHLENTSEQARIDQARAVAQVVGADALPSIVGGDLNAAPASGVLATLGSVLSDSWAGVGTGDGMTHPAWAPRARIDYLLYRGGLTPLTSDVHSSAVSDHRAVRTVFELPTPTDEVRLPQLG